MAEIQGMFRVNKNNMFSGNIQYAVCFLKDRLLFVKVGGEFADSAKATTGAMFGGLIGAAVGAAMDKNAAKKDNQKDPMIQRLSELSVEELLKQNKSNFDMPHDSISKINLEKASYNLAYGKPRSGVITFERLGKKAEKFDISGKDDLEECRTTLVERLPGKMVI